MNGEHTSRSTTPAGPRLDILDRATRVAVILPPLRQQILARLGEPQSATTLGRDLGIPRQKVNYHLRELEREGFVELAEERKRRGCVERLVRATAETYLVLPQLFEELATEPPGSQDRFSSAYLIVRAARLMRDVAVLRDRAQRAEQKLLTLTLDLDVAFESPAQLRRFMQAVTLELSRLAQEHGQAGEGGRRYQFVVGGHPTITKTEAEAARESSERRLRASDRTINTIEESTDE